MRAVRVLLALSAALAVAGALSSPLAAQATAQVPTPESVLGFRVGADFHLATFEQSLAYFERLDAASDRLELRRVGTTSFGRDSYIALISSAENLREVERYRDIAQRLAHAGDLTDADRVVTESPRGVPPGRPRSCGATRAHRTDRRRVDAPLRRSRRRARTPALPSAGPPRRAPAS
jgi:hypothetical protein